MRLKQTNDGRKNGGKRKVRRDLSTSLPLHLVIKFTRKVYEHRKFVDHTLKKYARKFGVCIFDSAIALDHVHFVTKVPNRESYVKFIRAVTGALAVKLGRNLVASVFTRIASWGRDYFNLVVYCRKNREEAFWSFHFAGKFHYHRAKPRFAPR